MENRLSVDDKDWLSNNEKCRKTKIREKYISRGRISEKGYCEEAIIIADEVRSKTAGQLTDSSCCMNSERIYYSKKHFTAREYNIDKDFTVTKLIIKTNDLIILLEKYSYSSDCDGYIIRKTNSETKKPDNFIDLRKSRIKTNKQSLNSSENQEEFYIGKIYTEAPIDGTISFRMLKSIIELAKRTNVLRIPFSDFTDNVLRISFSDFTDNAKQYETKIKELF